MLKGKKTYIVVICALLSAAAAYFQGDITLGTAMIMGFQAVMVATGRVAIASIDQKIDSLPTHTADPDYIE